MLFGKTFFHTYAWQEGTVQYISIQCITSILLRTYRTYKFRKYVQFYQICTSIDLRTLLKCVVYTNKSVRKDTGTSLISLEMWNHKYVSLLPLSYGRWAAISFWEADRLSCHNIIIPDFLCHWFFITQIHWNY